MMTVEGVDYAFTRVDEQKLAAAGKVFAMRYVGPGSQAKHLTAAERDRIWAANLGIVLLAEGAADSALGGRSVGIQHAEQALAAARALGAPLLPIYFAVDFDVTPGQWPAVNAYLKGAGSVIGTSRVGIYGGLRAVQMAARDGVAAWYFQTYAWSAGKWYAGNHVEQYHNGVSLAGGTVDLCRAKKPIYGQWTKAKEAAVADTALSTTEAKQLNDAWYVITQGAKKADGTRTDIRQLFYDATAAAKEQGDAIKALSDQVAELSNKLDALTPTTPTLHYTASGDLTFTPLPPTP